MAQLVAWYICYIKSDNDYKTYIFAPNEFLYFIHLAPFNLEKKFNLSCEILEMINSLKNFCY